MHIQHYDLTDTFNSLTPFSHCSIELEMPEGAKLLTVQLQNGPSCFLWAMVDPEAKKEKRTILILGTGRELELSGLSYIATINMWHFFEKHPNDNIIIDSTFPYLGYKVIDKCTRTQNNK